MCLQITDTSGWKRGRKKYESCIMMGKIKKLFVELCVVNFFKFDLERTLKSLFYVSFANKSSLTWNIVVHLSRSFCYKHNGWRDRKHQSFSFQSGGAFVDAFVLLLDLPFVELRVINSQSILKRKGSLWT